MLRDNFYQDKTPPGDVYAELIAAGNAANPLSNITGAGMINFTYGRYIKLVLLPDTYITSQGQSLHFASHLSSSQPITAPRVAIWWPESTSAGHNDIDLTVSSAGSSRSSLSGPSVFEKVAFGAVPSETFDIGLYGYSVIRSPQRVHVAALVTY